MKTTAFSLSLPLLLAGAAAWAQSTQLTAPPARISDVAIQTDHDAYRTLQNRIHQLNERGVPVRDYHLSKAQCWLDVSLHEYTRNDRSTFPQEAMTESEKLIVALERKATPLPMETPLVNGAARLRPDLWARTQALQQHAGGHCAWREVACAEVELVHAGNEYNQQQWRHAKPYVQIAEELVADADARAQACLPPPAPAPAPVAAAVVPPEPVVVPPPPPPPQAVSLQARVLFDFDRFTPEHIRPASRAELDQLVARIKSQQVSVQSLTLVGYADRLNSTGNKRYNQELSQKRVSTVRDLLVAQGLTVSSVSIDARGDSDQVAACQAKFKKPAELQECLLPNRRVQVDIQGLQPAPQP